MATAILCSHRELRPFIGQVSVQRQCACIGTKPQCARAVSTICPYTFCTVREYYNPVSIVLDVRSVTCLRIVLLFVGCYIYCASYV